MKPLNEEELIKMDEDELKDMLAMYAGDDWKLIRKVLHYKKHNKMVK